MTINLKLSFELQFLSTCCQPESSALNDIRDIIEEIDDWEGLSALAHQHGIFPLFYLALKRYADTLVPPDILEKFKAKNMAIVQRNMLMSSELLKIMRLLGENNIEALAFKGPALAQMAYGNITLRQYGDLDILLRVTDLFDAATLLSNNGYTLHGSIDFLSDSVWIEAAKDMTLISQEKNIILEMHWKLFHSTFAKHTCEIDLWHKSERITINQTDITTLNINILLAYLCIHGSRHLWERLEWIVDIDRLIKNKKIDWEIVLKTAEQFQSKTMLFLGLSLAHSLLQTELPSEIKVMIKIKKIEYLTPIIINLLETPIPREPSTADIIRRKSIHSAMQDSFYGQIMFWKNVLFQKNDTVILAENRPNRHTSLLDWGRPYRLFRKFILSNKR